jgi:hypothetical protein
MLQSVEQTWLNVRVGSMYTANGVQERLQHSALSELRPLNTPDDTELSHGH